MPTVDVEKKLTAQILKEINDSLIRGLFTDEQKGFCKWTRDTGELLDIDQHIVKGSKTRRKNLAMAWIDYKEAYGIVPQRWIIEYLKMYKISGEVIKFLEHILEN